VAGREFPALDDPEARLVVAPDGVTLRTSRRVFTVSNHGCAAALAWPDGARQLVGLDGVSVAVEPSRYDLDAAAVQELTRGVHPALVVPMPPRDASDVPTRDAWLPRPAAPAQTTPPTAARPPARTTAWTPGAAVVVAVLSALAFLMTLFVLLGSLDNGSDPDQVATWTATAALAAIPGWALT